MVWKRRRSSIKDNDFDFTTINEKGVDKFRVGVKKRFEGIATDRFLV